MAGPGARDAHGEDLEEERALFPRHRTADLLAAAERAHERRLVRQGWVLGAALALLALGLPTERLWGSLAEVRAGAELGAGGAPATPLGWTAAGLARLAGLPTERAWFLLAALAYGLSLPVVAGLLRAVGFAPASALLAAATAAAAPLAWLGGTLPGPFPAGVLGASWLARTLFVEREAERRRFAEAALLAWAGALVLDLTCIWLFFAVVWAIARHPHPAAPVSGALPVGARGLAAAGLVVAVAAVWAAGGFEERALLGGEPRPGHVDPAWLAWPLVALGPGLAGLAALAGRRAPEESPPPGWLLPWCAAAGVPALAGLPVGPAAPWLLPALALGLADRIARASREERALRSGLVLLAAQVVACALVAWATDASDPSRAWRGHARRELEPSDLVICADPTHAYLLRVRWGVDVLELEGASSDGAAALERARAAVEAGRRVVLDGEPGSWPAGLARALEEAGALRLAAPPR